MSNLFHMMGVSISMICFLHCLIFFLGYFGLSYINLLMLNFLNDKFFHNLFVLLGIFFALLITSNLREQGGINVKFKIKIILFAILCLTISFFMNEVIAELFIGLGAACFLLVHILEMIKKKSIQ